jgi:RNA polymerase sigma-70 factor (ECF subfamily)
MDAPHSLPDPGLVDYDAHADRSLRRLARHLVQDAATADDVVQDAWLAALRERRARVPQGWLRTVTRRLATGSRRRSELRRWHEAEAAVPESYEVKPEIEEDELHQALVSSLAHVTGRLGQVLRMRYIEGLKLHEIAERLDVPLGTVKSDHARGLQAIRTTLDDAQGGSRRWALALVPFVLREEELAPRALSVTARAGWVAAGAAALLGVGALGAWAHSNRGTEPESRVAVSPSGLRPAMPAVVEELSPRSDPEPAHQVAVETPVAPERSERTLATPAAAEPAVVPSEPLRPRVVVRALAEGRPLVGALVVAMGKGMKRITHATVDDDGEVVLELDPDALRAPHVPGGAPTVFLSLYEPDRAAPHSVLFEVRAGAPRTVTIAQDEPSLSLGGAVVDDRGVPIAGAFVYADPRDHDAGPVGRRRVARAACGTPGHGRQRRVRARQARPQGIAR